MPQFQILYSLKYICKCKVWTLYSYYLVFNTYFYFNTSSGILLIEPVFKHYFSVRKILSLYS